MTIDTRNLVAKPTAEELKRQFDTDPAAFIRLVKPAVKFAYKTRSKQKNASKALWKYETGSHTVIIANPKDIIAHTNPGQQVTTLDKPNRNRITVPGTNYTREFGIARHSLAGGFLDAPTLAYSDHGELGFVDGRHRTALAATLGITEIPFYIELDDLKFVKFPYRRAK